MRAGHSLRVPLQIGTSAVFSLARASAFIVPGALLLAIPMAILIYFEVGDIGDAAAYIFAPGLIVFGFSWKHLKRALSQRPSDLLLTATGFEVRGGPHAGKQFAWADLSKVTLERPPKLEDKSEDESDLRQLWIHRRAGSERILLAAAESGLEQQSIAELARTLEAGCGVHAEYAPRAPVSTDAVDLLVCPECAAAVAPVDAETVVCAFCTKPVRVPEDVRKKLRDAADVARRPDSAVAKLLDQPGAGYLTALQAFAALFMLSAWPVALVLTARNYLEHALSAKGVGFLLLFVAACIMGFLGIIRGRLVDRQALRLVALDFGALPPSAPGKPYLCRQCLAPLGDAGERVLVGCVYCGAENVLGIDLHRDASVARAESRSLAKAMARRTVERRRWRGVSLVAVTLIALSVYSLRNGIGHNPKTWPLEQKCAQKDLAACTTLGELISVLESEEVRVDRKRAANLFERGCTGGFAAACVDLADLYLDVVAPPRGTDRGRAKELIARGCQLGHDGACFRMKQP